MIRVKNIYHMLAYAFSVLRESGYEEVTSEEFDHSADLFAAILSKGVANQIRRGLGKSYLEKTEALLRPTGRISISDSIKNQTLVKKQLICNFDQHSENIDVNRILKTTILFLLNSGEVQLKHKRMLKKSYVFFENVDVVDPKRIKWSKIQYHRNNTTYRMLMHICYMVLEGMLMSEGQGTQKLTKYMDDRKMHQLYEKFLYHYYKKHYPKLSVSAAQIEWQVDDGVMEDLPVMKSDVLIEGKSQILIIDAKYYAKTMQVREEFSSHKIHSSNLYQIFTYVKNQALKTDKVVQGLLLYAKTDEMYYPKKQYKMSGNMISALTLDLGHDFQEIKKQLDDIIQIHFD